eukprot:CAMPEP_0185605228 /NCGR_PEP_ID=MMETSP0436-20130131/3875_1 /TAXON_ID=626734 ORGANISM="Favella taraikaensis, Strain Fe Narragansett Bay" /NCGR_SAMPLE_ID=MMETSP0436 /ASSEMBLY_ACC=CAM_ASM_000390 /LENGTH=72 /DNA_ID=CAMNT_0028236347 /DNA_START=920 /DNA_END=1138 /DNA_ORIENTATION=-
MEGLDRRVEEISLAEEGLCDDSDEEVEEHLTANQLEQNEEDVGACAAAAGEGLAPIGHNRVVVFVFSALELD